MAASKKMAARVIEGLEGRRLYSASAYEAKWDALPPIYTQEYISQPVATLKHPASADLSGLNAIIDWGDGTREFDNQQTHPLSDTLLSVTCGTGIHGYSKVGTYTAKVTFSQGNTILATASKAIRVSQNSIGGQSAKFVAGVESTTVLGTITASQAPGTLTVLWGDGQSAPAEVTPLKNHQYRVAATHAYSKAGFYRVRVGSDLTGNANQPVATDVLGSTAVVREPSASQPALVAPANGPLYVGSSLVATLSGVKANPLARLPRATIDWGDGVIDAATVEIVGGRYAVMGDVPEYAIPQARTITVKLFSDEQVNPAKDKLIASLIESVALQPTSAGAVPVTIAPGVGFSGTLGVITASASRTPVSLKVEWGDIDPFAPLLADFSGNPSDALTIAPIGNNQFQISGSHTYFTAGRYFITGGLVYSDGTVDKFVDVVTVGTTSPPQMGVYAV